MGLADFIREMPKVELHIHLEGSIDPTTLLALAERNGVPLPASDLKGLEEFYHFTDFDHFIQVYVTISRCLRTADDFRLIAYEFGAEMARQRIRYAEVTFQPLYPCDQYRPALRRDCSRSERRTLLRPGRLRCRIPMGV